MSKEPSAREEYALIWAHRDDSSSGRWREKAITNTCKSKSIDLRASASRRNPIHRHAASPHTPYTSYTMNVARKSRYWLMGKEEMAHRSSVSRIILGQIGQTLKKGWCEETATLVIYRRNSTGARFGRIKTYDRRHPWRLYGMYCCRRRVATGTMDPMVESFCGRESTVKCACCSFGGCPPIELI